MYSERIEHERRVYEQDTQNRTDVRRAHQLDEELAALGCTLVFKGVPPDVMLVTVITARGLAGTSSYSTRNGLWARTRALREALAAARAADNPSL